MLRERRDELIEKHLNAATKKDSVPEFTIINLDESDENLIDND